MDDLEKQLKDVNADLEFFKLHDCIKRFRNRIERNQAKLDKLSKKPEKLTNLPADDVLVYLKTAGDELLHMRKLSVQFFQFYEKLYKYATAVSKSKHGKKDI
ncbi:MAG: hypothetical protein IJN19_01785 [Opitutales bacterium]|nr:hypothetical protein [Opitutales bacterium]